MSPPVWLRPLLLAAVCIVCPGLSGQTRSPLLAIDPPQTSAPRPLSREDAERLLLERNAEVRVARAALQAASADIQRVDVSPNPTLSASLSNTAANRYRPGETDRIIRVEQLFERADKRALRTAGARLLETAARAELSDTVRQQRIALAVAYNDLAAAQHIARLTRDTADGYVTLLAVSERRLRAGDIAAVDLARMRVEAARAAQSARAAAADTVSARLSLGTVLGISDDTLRLHAVDALPMHGVTDTLALPPPPEQIAAGIERRADMLAASARRDAAGRARELAVRQRTRDFLIGLQTEHAPAFGGHVIGVSVSVPLLIGNDYTGDIARAHAEETIADEMLARTRALARADIARASERLAAARDRARLAAERALPEAQRAADGVEFAFVRGAAPLTDLLDARRQLAAVQIETIRTSFELAAAVEIYKITINPQEAQ